MTQFDRQIQLRILLSKPAPDIGYAGNLEIDNLHMAFTVVKTLGLDANTGNIQVWNLSQSNRKRLENYGDQIRIFAGYRFGGGPQLLFTGNTTQVSHIWAEPDFISSFNCGDGERDLNNKNLVASFAPNTSAETVMRDLASRLQLEIAYFGPHENKIYFNGFSDAGNAKILLKKVADYLNMTISVQNNNLYLLPQGQSIAKPPALIDANSGMIGIPERYTDLRGYYLKVGPKTGWKVRTLLNPFIIPGDPVRLKSTQAVVDGLFYVEKITHTGDNYGSDFTSLLELVAI